ncbi:ROK family protein [Salinisphaera sp.]|uniref:ROK family protein n=1 Tax=Salinisphaera sp. TaxID=1914330 RepID=UPI000C48EB12|nr:ROK family protein [Salinisphaera sp.]MAS09595.1 fructokinase [Salinisphaera sp.]|tara:strand:+ start:8130 stop:9068 length:939 start_codon:yes stop_codon:yes gene_type:complete
MSGASNPDRGLRIGVDLGGTKIAGIVLDGDAAVCAERRIDTPNGGYRETVEAIVDLVHALEQDVDQAGLPLGVGTPGSVLASTGRLRNANSQCLNGKPLGADLASALSRDVRLANDADCLALSEARDGAGAGHSNVFGVILGTGVGGGVVIDRQLITGRNGLAGEWGHTCLPWQTSAEARQPPRCWCGLDSCLEAWLSGPGMTADHVRRGGYNLPAHEIVQRAEAGERLAGATLKVWLQRVARSMAMVVNIVDPDVIVVGGGLSQIRWLYSEVPKIWAQHVFAESIDTPLLPAAHGDASGVRGAARLWPLSE